MYDYDLGFYAFLCLLILGLVFGLCYASYKLTKYNCHKTAEIYEVDSRFNWSAGCFYKHEGRFIPKSEYEKLLTPNYQMGNAEVNVKISE